MKKGRPRNSSSRDDKRAFLFFLDRGIFFLDGSWRIFEGLSGQAGNGLLRDSPGGENAMQKRKRKFLSTKIHAVVAVEE